MTTKLIITELRYKIRYASLELHKSKTNAFDRHYWIGRREGLVELYKTILDNKYFG